MRLMELADGFAVMPTAVAILKRVGDQCALYTAGQDATTEGFLVDETFENVLGDLNDALEDKDGV